MAVPKICLLEISPLMAYDCEMCGIKTRKNKFLWESTFTGKKITICRECAYKESFGTKRLKKSKKENILEKKETN